MNRIPQWTRNARAKCLISKAFALNACRLTGRVTPTAAIPVGGNSAIRLRQSGRLSPRILCAVPRLDVLRCAHACRSYAWAMGRGAGRAFDPPGGGASAMGGAREKRNPSPAPNFNA